MPNIPPRPPQAYIPPLARPTAKANQDSVVPNSPARLNPNVHPSVLPPKPEQARINAPGMGNSPGATIPPDPRPATPPIDGSKRPDTLPMLSAEEVPGKPGFHKTTESGRVQIDLPPWTGYHHANPVQWETLKQTDAAHTRFVGENQYGYVAPSHVQTHDFRTGQALTRPKEGAGPAETGNVYRLFRPDRPLSETNPLDPLYSGAGKTNPRTGEPLGPGKNDGRADRMRLATDASHIASEAHVHPSLPNSFPWIPSEADMISAYVRPKNSEGKPIDHIIAAPRPPTIDPAPGAPTHGDQPVGIIHDHLTYKTLLPPHPDAPAQPDFSRFTHPLSTDHPPGPPGPANFSGRSTGHTYPPGKDYPTNLEF